MFGKQDKMDVRCNSELETNRLSKNGHKEGKESKSAEGNISNSFLKEPQGTFSASGVSEDCGKNKSSSADPDYCRRILVRDAKGSIREIILPKASILTAPRGLELLSLPNNFIGLRWNSRGANMWLDGKELSWPGSSISQKLSLVPEPTHKAEKRPRQRLRDEVGGVRDRGYMQRPATPRTRTLALPPGLPGLLPPCATSALGSALRAPSLASRTGGSGSGTTGSSTHHPTVSSAAAGPAHPSPPGGHNLFSLPVPTLLGSVASRLSSNPLAMAGSLAGNLQELSARYLSSSAFEPYSRTASKESAEKKALD
ncbi:hypothetical protein E2320_008589 [Naja naja]|nr:hypothetical protein E2320_008589 [Naja naja]